MSRIAKIALAAALTMTAPSAFAATIFSDGLQTLGAPDPTKWAAGSSGQIVDLGGTLGKALHFNNVGVGSDLRSTTIGGAGTYQISVDYYCASASGCGGYLGLFTFPGVVTTNPASSDGWLATDTQDPQGLTTPYTLPAGGSGFQNLTFNVTVTSDQAFTLKLLDFAGTAGGTAGDAYFRNVSISTVAVPEPATWAMMVTGFGLVGFGLRNRRKQRIDATYA